MPLIGRLIYQKAPFICLSKMIIRLYHLHRTLIFDAIAKIHTEVRFLSFRLGQL